MSTNTPPAFVIPGDPQQPLRKRNSTKTGTFGETAHAILKIPKSDMAKRKTTLLPMTSDTGPNTNGPAANPRR